MLRDLVSERLVIQFACKIADTVTRLVSAPPTGTDERQIGYVGAAGILPFSYTPQRRPPCLLSPSAATVHTTLGLRASLLQHPSPFPLRAWVLTVFISLA